jgi:c-di-GMP-binding flagellar brake protein YcgR
MDLSGGGVRMLVGTKKPLPQLQDSQYLLLSIGLKSEDIEEPIDMVAKLLKSTRFVREGEVYYEFRVCFITKNKRDCEKIVKFVFQEERKNRKVK